MGCGIRIPSALPMVPPQVAARSQVSPSAILPNPDNSRHPFMMNMFEQEEIATDRIRRMPH